MNPEFSCQPVILMHLSMTGAAAGLTVCSGQPFIADGGSHPHVPRVLCEACRRIANSGEIECRDPNEPPLTWDQRAAQETEDAALLDAYSEGLIWRDGQVEL